MGDQTKKISFGFSKIAKKTNIVSSHLNKNKPEDDVSKVEFIDCLEGKSIRLKDPVELDQGPLIIPLTRTKEKSLSQQVNSENIENKDISKDLKHKSTNECSEISNEENRKSLQTNEINQNDGQNKLETLDEVAAREILEELNRKKADDDEKRVFSVPLTSNAPSGVEQSTLEDYDKVPVADFGMAVIRGMGWAPGKGIGKTEKLVAPTLPAPRPKGMGLGADKVIKSFEKKNTNEDLKMVKGSFIRVLAGSEKDAYGQVEGFDDESGRLIVKLALKNISISLNEFMVQLVDTNEFKKNSKVINVSKYEQYKEAEVKKESSEKSQEEVLDKIRHRELLSPQSEKFGNKSKVFKKNRSSSCEIEEENLKDAGTKVSSDSPESRSARFKGSSSRSSRSPSDRNKIKERSQSKGNKHQSTKYDSSSKYNYKSVTSDNKKHRSRSSDSSGSSSSYRNKNKSSSTNTSTKNSVKDRSVSRRRSSSNSSTSDSSGNHSRKKKNKYKKKRSSTNKYRSRSRSRSPRKHKHKKTKTAARH